ncbi:MAG TPA: TolC family protein, partial [Orrella sp.]
MNKALAYAAFGITACLTLLGCAAPKQTFVDPITDTPASWSSTLPTQELKDASRYPWWQALENSRLDSLVDQALAQNTSVARSAKAVQLANQQLNTVKLGWLPSLTLFGGRITGNTSLFFQGLPIPVSDVGNFVGILPNYFINLFRLPYEQRQAMELVDVARAQMLAVRLAIAGEVVSAYALALSAQQELVLLRELSGRIARQERLLTDLQSVGMASQSMVNQVKAQQSGIRGQMALARANAVAARNALNILVRNPLGTELASDSLENVAVG